MVSTPDFGIYLSQRSENQDNSKNIKPQTVCPHPKTSPKDEKWQNQDQTYKNYFSKHKLKNKNGNGRLVTHI
jgi:hypothetical protein